MNESLIELLNHKYCLDKEVLKIIIETIPANVFFKDTECRYQMVSHLCDMLNRREEGWTIIGKTDLEVQPDPELGRFYYEDDKRIMETLKGNHYISEMVFGGAKYYYEITKEPAIDANGNVIGVVGLVNDITELKKLQEELRIMSITDNLTGAFNRTYFQQKKDELILHGYNTLSIIMCDSNGLKFLNDNFGHQKGDALLIETVKLMKNVLGDAGEIIRIGGDEFIVFCLDCDNIQCKAFIEALRLKEKEIKDLGIPISNSYGYSTISGNTADLENAIKTAEDMMYQEKAKVKAPYIKELLKTLA